MRSWSLLLVLAGCPAPPPTEPPPVVVPALAINEVQSDNRTTVADPANDECPEHDDWVELLNTSDAPLDIGGIELRDQEGRGYLLPPRVLEPGGRVLVWADDQPEQGPLHAPFGVSRDGESVELWSGTTLLDHVDVPALPADGVWARFPDGGPTWRLSVATPDAPNTKVLPDDPCFDKGGGFDDHGYPCIPDRDGFFALAGGRKALSVVKFDIFAFQDPARRRISFVDTDFYVLHDQYYIYTVLNGREFEGLTDYPVYPGSFADWVELRAWADTIELDDYFPAAQIRFAGDRLYSPYFYQQINGDGRHLGVGTVVHLEPTATRDEIWGFELEFGDDIAIADLEVYFEMLEAHGPPELADVHWLVRSTEQEATAQAMEASGNPYADRLIRYSELSEPGEVEVYNPGLTAGRVLMVRAGEDGLEEARSDMVLVLDEIPDFLPPCSALITSVPQTPLSHISLLARSRGIPNLYVAGITQDPEWDAWSRVRSPVALEATEGGELRVALMSGLEFVTWQGLLDTPVPVLESVDPTTLPWSFDLATAPSMLDLRPQVGGKAAGMRELLTVPGVDTPDLPLGLTIRGYHAYVDQLDWLPGLLNAPPFVGVSDARLRFFVLEGREAFDLRFATPADVALRDAFLSGNPVGTHTGDLARGRGLHGLLEDLPLPPAVQQGLLPEITAHFASIPDTQGLRFRSSSNVEDIEGFNGAGLYTSHTGHRNGSPSVEDALRRVWASYWNHEAFEERRSAGIDHLDGGMGVLVHPAFDDDRELSNHVLTVSLLPDGDITMLANAQIGAISVANPPNTCPAVLPEQVRVTAAGVERISPSTEVAPGEQVLSDAQLQALYTQTSAVVLAWLDEENAALPPAHQRSVLTLDLESREMAAGWPDGSALGPRLVVKQSRSLEPSTAHLPEDVVALAVPRDVLARARTVDSTICTGSALRVRVESLTTDPLMPPDMGYATDPFVATLEITALSALPGIGWSAFDSLLLDPLTADVSLGADGSIDAVFANGALSVAADGTWALEIDGGSDSGGPLACAEGSLWASPDTFLADLLE